MASSRSHSGSTAPVAVVYTTHIAVPCRSVHRDTEMMCAALRRGGVEFVVTDVCMAAPAERARARAVAPPVLNQPGCVRFPALVAPSGRLVHGGPCDDVVFTPESVV